MTGEPAPSHEISGTSNGAGMRSHQAMPRISSEPIINFAFRWIADLAFAAFVLSIIYMSFVPFDLTLTQPDRGWRAGRVILGLSTSPFNLPDILANIAYYVPISMLGFFVFRRRVGWFAASFAVLVGGAALSFGVEYGQQWTLSRVPAWPDFVANVLGLTLGLGLAYVLYPFARLFARSAGESLAADPIGSAAKLTLCMLVLIQVRPFDLATDVPRTVLNTVRYGDFRATARWELLTGSSSPKANPNLGRTITPSARSRHEYVMDQLATVAGYAALSCLMVLSMRKGRTAGRVPSLLWSGFVTISLAAIMTGLRVLMLSHGLDTMHLPCGIVGWLLGVLAARAIDRAGHSSNGPRLAISMAVAAWVIAYELIPFDFAWTSVSAARAAGRVTLLPMSAHFAGSVPNLVADLSGKFLRYGALAACLVAFLSAYRRLQWRRQSLLVAVATALVVGVMQFVHVYQPDRVCDVTNVLIAGFAACAAVVSLRAATDLTCASPRLVDDMLTRQLIDGESYDKNAVTALRKRRSGASRKQEAPAGRRD